MEKTTFNIAYRNESGQLLECRQCSHKTKLEATHEADLYAAWAKYHYKCEVYYSIKAYYNT